MGVTSIWWYRATILCLGGSYQYLVVQSNCPLFRCDRSRVFYVPLVSFFLSYFLSLSICFSVRLFLSLSFLFILFLSLFFRCLSLSLCLALFLCLFLPPSLFSVLGPYKKTKEHKWKSKCYIKKRKQLCSSNGG